ENTHDNILFPGYTNQQVNSSNPSISTYSNSSSNNNNNPNIGLYDNNSPLDLLSMLPQTHTLLSPQVQPLLDRQSHSQFQPRPQPRTSVSTTSSTTNGRFI